MYEGIQSLVSNQSVDETVARLQTLLQQKGVKLFCLIDHSGEALAAGITMRPTKLPDLRQSQGWNSADACSAQRRARPSTQDSGRAE